MSRNDTYPQHVVTAVIVAHDGAAWLPHVIDGLLEQTRPVQRVVAVDTGSRDRSGAVLAAKLGPSVVFGMDRATGYGAAVAKALQHKAATVSIPGPSVPGRGERVEWVWLLHDDCEPAADALEQLLRGAAETPNAAVLGPKVMDWSDRDVILEAGLTIDTVGRRVTGIEPREVDQGQHDGDRDTLAVGSPGMLVRRDVWDMVRGFDTSMGLFRDDIDFCWRVHAAGYRVRVITDAVVFHAQAISRRRRAVSVGRRSRLLDRRNALLTLAGNLPLGPMLLSLVGNVAVSLLRALFFLVAKRVAAALDESAAVASVLCHPLRLARVRRLRARGRKVAYGRLRADLPPGRSFRRVAEFAAAMLSSAQQDTAGSHHATEDPADDDFLLTDSGFVQRTLTNPAVLLFLGLVIVTGVAERSLLGAGSLGGGALLPATGGASGLWRDYLQGFHPTGIGSPSLAPSYLAVLALLSTVLLGKAWLAVNVLLLGSVPIAGMTAFLAVRRVTTSVLVRVWAAATYALIPVATGAISAGRLGTATAFALVPVICLLAGRMLSKPPRLARRAAWATGLAIAVGAAFVPLLWLIAVLAAIPAALVLRTRAAMLRNLGIVVLVPPVLLIPWTFEFIAHPTTLLLEAGNQQAGLASPALPTRSLMLLSPGGPGLPPVWVTAGLALAAFVALLASRRRPLVMSGWLVALLGLLVAALVSRLSVQPAAGGAPVTVWPGIALAITAAGLLLAAAAGGDSLGALLAGGRSGLRRIASPRGLAVGMLAIVACSAPALAAASWLRSGVSGPVGPASGQVVPALVTVSAANGQHPRTLVLRSVGGHVSYQLLRGSGPALGDADLIPVPGAERALRTAVASLVAPAGGLAVNQGQVLAHFDIAFVLMRAPVSPGLARILDGIAGLRPVSTTARFALWRLTTMPSRVSVTEPNGTVVPVPSGQVSVSGAAAPAAGGTLTLAEPTGGWHATLNGHPLSPVPSPAGSWAQAFRLPSGGGTLDISHGELGHDLGIAFELLAALVVAALALPGVRPATEAQAAAEAATAAGTPDAGAPAGRPADPAAGRVAGGAAGRGAGDAARRGGKGRSRGRGLGRRGRRPDGDEPMLPGPQRPRPGVSSGPVGRIGGAAAAAGAAAGLAAGSARLGARPSRRDAARAGAGLGDAGLGDAEGTGTGRGGAGRGDAARGGAGRRGAAGRGADRGAADRGAPGRAAAASGGRPNEDWADPAAAEWADPAAPARSGRPGGREPAGRVPGGREPAPAVPDPGLAGPPRRDGAVRSPTGAWPYPEDATQVAAPSPAAGARRGARPEPAGRPAYADRADYAGQPDNAGYPDTYPDPGGYPDPAGRPAPADAAGGRRGHQAPPARRQGLSGTPRNRPARPTTLLWTPVAWIPVLWTPAVWTPAGRVTWRACRT